MLNQLLLCDWVFSYLRCESKQRQARQIRPQVLVTTETLHKALSWSWNKDANISRFFSDLSGFFKAQLSAWQFSLQELWRERGVASYCWVAWAYLTGAKRSAGDFLHWHPFAKRASVERGRVGAGPWALLPAPATPCVAVRPLGPWRPTPINCKTQSATAGRV